MKILRIREFAEKLALTAVFIATVIAAGGQDPYSLYKTSGPVKGVWTIVENNTVNIYLVAGKDSALVIDTGYGLGDLKGYIRTITTLPLIVVNTHGHGDHAGNDHQFEKVYSHPDDSGLIASVLNPERRKKAIAARNKEKKYSDGELDAMVKGPMPRLIPVKEGYVFDLGGRKLEVIVVPGHTPGSICFLDKKNKILFAGDHTNAIVWLFLKDCLPLETYLKSLEKVKGKIRKFNLIMPGHNAPLPKNFIYEQISCVKSILDGTCQSVPYKYGPYTSGVMLCRFKTSEVAYNPENLFVEKKK